MKQGQRIKKHHSYTIGEIARTLGVHKRTVRRWATTGLPCCVGGRPTLILGGDLKDFLYHRRAKKRRRCNEGQLYCVACRMPKHPAGKMVDLIQMSTSAGESALTVAGLCIAPLALPNWKRWQEV
jgi:hypothetical protein